jgi:hypothetical protein
MGLKCVDVWTPAVGRLACRGILCECGVVLAGAAAWQGKGSEGLLQCVGACGIGWLVRNGELLL